MNQGNILRILIKGKDLTQQEFADQIGVSKNWVQTLTTKAKLSPKTIDRMAKELGVDPSVFSREEIEEEGFLPTVSNVQKTHKNEYPGNPELTIEHQKQIITIQRSEIDTLKDQLTFLQKLLFDKNTMTMNAKAEVEAANKKSNEKNEKGM